MTGQQLPVIPDQNVRSMQIIVGALTLGVLMFAGLDAALWASGSVPKGPGSGIISYTALAVGVAVLLVHAVMMTTQARAIRRRLADANLTPVALAGLYAVRLIVGAALLEGAAFYFLVAFLLDGLAWTFAGGLVFAVLIPILHFPTRDRVGRWIEAQRQRAAG
jgi:hypothetical protein